jgi:hypothetical protein
MLIFRIGCLLLTLILSHTSMRPASGLLINREPNLQVASYLLREKSVIARGLDTDYKYEYIIIIINLGQA